MFDGNCKSNCGAHKGILVNYFFCIDNWSLLFKVVKQWGKLQYVSNGYLESLEWLSSETAISAHFLNSWYFIEMTFRYQDTSDSPVSLLVCKSVHDRDSCDCFLYMSHIDYLIFHKCVLIELFQKVLIRQNYLNGIILQNFTLLLVIH